ncbi:hypothetical protein N8499_01090 [Akkermansiaceae bacterium]|nr:hypothetical protein [Akkermansiaceae bacterium]
MANFQYIALYSNGEQQTGVKQGNSDAEVIQALRAEGLYPTQVVPEGQGGIALTPEEIVAAIGKKGETTKPKGKGCLMLLVPLFITIYLVCYHFIRVA